MPRTAHQKLTGSMTALITPFKGDKIDDKAFQSFCEFQIDNGTTALIPVGTTGESPTLSHEEHHRVVELCIEVAKSKRASGKEALVIAGAGSNSTTEAIGFARHAEKLGADYILSVSPYYNKPNQEGLYLHFKAIHDACGLPIILYNIPGRSIVDIHNATMARLAELPRIIGVKDATADLSRPPRLRALAGADFVQLSGEDATILPFLIQGGHGCISVTSNVAPRLLADMHLAWQKGDMKTAQAINEKLTALHEALFLEPSPGPVKYAASRLNLCAPDTRLPLAPITAATKAAVDKGLQLAGLVGG
ncbi:MAG: 4-hydroxy-tetrahydrodipicolinate synthase [Alphaproteobacteria bacterium]|nr:4-hydroxy-tetrahydrodipicolinate synthase [Alphaproteobacteria bacterium]